MRILYVEDDSRVRETVSSALKSAGHLVCIAQDCSTALDMIKEGCNVFDILLSDIETPGEIDGWQLAECARAYAPAMPVIYSTGSSLEKARPVANGRILRKPFSRMALLSAVEQAQAMVGCARHIFLPLSAADAKGIARRAREASPAPAEAASYRPAPAVGARAASDRVAAPL